MNEFIAGDPAVAIWLISILASLIGFLVYGILFFVKRSFDNLTRAITSLEQRFDKGQTDIGFLKDRMATQEAICAMQRVNCPSRNILQDLRQVHTPPPRSVPSQ